MEQHDYRAYLVIKIPIQYRIDHVRYGCIPNSWLRNLDDGDIVVFGYPLQDDDEVVTKMRLINYEPLDKTWPTLHGEVVFHTDSYDEAIEFLEKEMNDLKSGTDQTKNTNDKVGEKTTPKQITDNLTNLPSDKTNQPSKQKKLDQENILQSTTVCNELGQTVDLQILETHDIIRIYAKDLGYEDTEFFSTSNISHDTQIPDPNKMLPIETDDEAMKEIPVSKEQNSKKIMERPRRKSTCQIISYAECSTEESDSSDDSNDLEVEDSDNYVEIHNSPQPRTSGECIPVRDNNSLDKQDITMHLLDDPVQVNLYNLYVDLNESFQKAMTSCDKAANYMLQIIAERKEKIDAEANQSSTVKHTEAMFSQPQPLLQERVRGGHEGSKWTLRYPELGPGIIELLPNTGVYVSREGLNECISAASKTAYNKTTKLTLRLLEEIFTDEALKTCTFFGRRKKFGLNLKARQTLVGFVLKYSSEMGWEKTDLKAILICIRNKLSRSNKISNKNVVVK